MRQVTLASQGSFEKYGLKQNSRNDALKAKGDPPALPGWQ
jgi:hypothetical protein